MPNLAVPYPSGGKIAKLTGSGYHRDLLVGGSFDYDVFEDKFWGDALLDEYPAAKTNGTSAAVTFTEHNSNGYLDLVSGTTDNGYAGQGLGLQFNGDRGVLVEFIIKTPAADSTMKWEIGLSDADDDAGAVNQKAATTTATATDFAVFCYDTDDDDNIATISANGGTVTTTQDIVAAAVSTTYRLAVRVNGDTVTFWLNGEPVGAGHTIEGGNDLTPWAFVQARAGAASRTLQLHKWRVTQPAW
tara:strand:+ start:2176 stop:2907 length:732 start_codon:yes stop_codon:yes gene_type:complete